MVCEQAETAPPVAAGLDLLWWINGSAVLVYCNKGSSSVEQPSKALAWRSSAQKHAEWNAMQSLWPSCLTKTSTETDTGNTANLVPSLLKPARVPLLSPPTPETPSLPLPDDDSQVLLTFQLGLTLTTAASQIPSHLIALLPAYLSHLFVLTELYFKCK